MPAIGAHLAIGHKVTVDIGRPRRNHFPVP